MPDSTVSHIDYSQSNYCLLTVDYVGDLRVGECHLVDDCVGGVEVEAALRVEVGGPQAGEEGGVGTVGVALRVVTVCRRILPWLDGYGGAVRVAAAIEVAERGGQVAVAVLGDLGPSES